MSKDLTPMQQKVLTLIALGYTSKEVATLLNSSPYTVRKHRDSILRRMGAHTMPQAVYLAFGNKSPGGGSHVG